MFEFEGVQRRFTKIFSFNNVSFYDDYAHHPTEIKEVINGINEVYKEKKILCIFQPHRISRLRALRREFSYAFNIKYIIKGDLTFYERDFPIE